MRLLNPPVDFKPTSKTPLLPPPPRMLNPVFPYHLAGLGLMTSFPIEGKPRGLQTQGLYRIVNNKKWQLNFEYNVKK